MCSRVRESATPPATNFLRPSPQNALDYLLLGGAGTFYDDKQSIRHSGFRRHRRRVRDPVLWDLCPVQGWRLRPVELEQVHAYARAGAVHRDYPAVRRVLVEDAGLAHSRHK